VAVLGRWRRRRPGGLEDRVSGGKRRGDHGEHRGALTGRGNERRTAGDGEQKHRAVAHGGGGVPVTMRG
jgi:hypothetical protein